MHNVPRDTILKITNNDGKTMEMTLAWDSDLEDYAAAFLQQLVFLSFPYKTAKSMFAPYIRKEVL